jgi:ParB family transcriptional regulator, chromosome partitioning protein
MTALNLDMADWWEPTPENYLLHVSKDRLLEVVGEAVSPQTGQTLMKLKKSELVESANAKLSGLRWLPDNFKVKFSFEEI